MPAPRDPTHKTLRRKLEAAREALAASPARLIPVDYHRHVVNDLVELGVDEETYWSLLPRLIDAVLASDPAKCYAGSYPADRVNNHPRFKDLELWAFKTSLSEYPFVIYFKFCLKAHPTTKEIIYCHVDCHPNREKA